MQKHPCSLIRCLKLPSKRLNSIWKISGHSAADRSKYANRLRQYRTEKKEFLAQIERIVPWKEWLTLIQPCYYKGERGNKPYPLETMLRLYLLQNLYDLSDEATAA